MGGLKHSLKSFKKSETQQRKEMPNLGTLHKTGRPLPATLSSSSPSLSLIKNYFSKEGINLARSWQKGLCAHMNSPSASHRGKHRTWIKKLFKARYYWECNGREQYRNLPQQNTVLHVTRVSFSVLLVIIIRSCLVKKDNEGVYKSTGCLASSQLRSSWPTLSTAEPESHPAAPWCACPLLVLVLSPFSPTPSASPASPAKKEGTLLLKKDRRTLL